ncbi:MAG: MCP four helix bundle domain-containing protein, partial [Actinomycetales bacterium]
MAAFTAAFGNAKVSAKILAAVIIAAVAALVVGVLGISALGQVSTKAQDIYAQGLQPLKALEELKQAALQTRLDLLNHAVSSDASHMAKYDDKLRADDAAYDAALTAYQKFPQDGGRGALVADMQQNWTSYRTLRDTVMLPLSRKGDAKGFETARDEKSLPLTNQTTADLGKLIDIESKDAVARAASAKATYTSSRTLVILVLVAGIALALVAGVLVSRAIARPLSRVKDVLGKVADGDLRETVDVRTRDEVGQMADGLNRAVLSLRETVSTLGSSASTIAASSQQLSAISTQVASASEEAAAQANVVSAAAEQVSRNVQT